ncbi:MAG: GTPase ObgE, partial [Candidatus Staskawiczbacteria bacterium]
MIIDDVKISVIAGHGGNGLAVFSKTRKTLGPTGGSGGNGGNIFLEVVSDLGTLRQFRYKKVCEAKNGQNGKSRLNDGHDGNDLILFVPVGTLAHNLQNKKTFEINKIGQRELVAKGGRGGKGNYLFRSATNTSPRQFEQGKPGEAFELHLELKMIADVGFIGLPNVGKSSLLNELTNAKSKVANYPFTTLEPNLGVYYDLVLADIPGLIEGASEGKGLGTKFLKHIERTKVLFHFVAADSENPLQDYKTVRKELEIYNPLLVEKPEYIFISRSDTVEKNVIEKIKKEFKEIGKSAS